MKKLNKLEINSEKIINNAELLLLRGGYGACGNQQSWHCKVWIDGIYAFAGTSCGTQQYVSSTCTSMGYICECTEDNWEPMPI